MKGSVRSVLLVGAGLVGLAFGYTLLRWLGGDVWLGQTDHFLINVVALAGGIVALFAVWAVIGTVLTASEGSTAWAKVLRFCLYLALYAFLLFMALSSISNGQLFGWFVLLPAVGLPLVWVVKRVWKIDL